MAPTRGGVLSDPLLVLRMKEVVLSPPSWAAGAVRPSCLCAAASDLLVLCGCAGHAWLKRMHGQSGS